MPTDRPYITDAKHLQTVPKNSLTQYEIGVLKIVETTSQDFSALTPHTRAMAYALRNIAEGIGGDPMLQARRIIERIGE